MALKFSGQKCLAWGAGAITAGFGAYSLGFLAAPSASAYIGDSFLGIPGIAEGAAPAKDRKSIRIEAHYWAGANGMALQRQRMLRGRSAYSGPPVPQHSSGSLVFAIAKHSPFLRRLMRACAAKSEMPEVRFSESSFLARDLAQIGPRPASVPEFFEYQLKQARFVSCPVVADAPEQAFVLAYNDLTWTNYDGPARVPVTLPPATLRDVSLSGRTRAFVVSWFGVAHDVSADQCEAVNTKPAQEEFFAFKTAEEAQKIRADLAAKRSGIGYETEEMAYRGPAGLNVALLPGIVKDPGHISPRTPIARGLNLDRDDGRGPPPPGICRHKNYVAEDGRTGIDNQLFTVQGCMPGYMGHKGFLMQFLNEQRRNGLLSIMVIVSGIDNDKTDDSVDVTLAYSRDPMAKSAAGKTILPNYTFRLTDLSDFTHYFTRVHGRIENGVIVTDTAPVISVNAGIDPELILHQAAMRLEILPDGSLKGILAGYKDWRPDMMMTANSQSEALYGFRVPGLYDSYRRNADGLKDPETGECNGISAAYDIEGSAAFVAPEDMTSYFVQAPSRIRRDR